MKVVIYEIKNKINGKCYIGKTNNYGRRMSEHFSSYYRAKEPRKALYLSIEKYGRENFSCKILEEVSESNWEERETFWIAKKGSLLPDGYNMTKGGEAPPILKGEEASGAIFTQEEVDEIIFLLKNTKIPMNLIAKEFNAPDSRVWNINSGKYWRMEDENYPIRKSGNKEKGAEAQFLLESKQLSLVEIGDILEMSSEWVSAVNQGTIYKNENYNYPIFPQRPLSLEERKPVQEKALKEILFTTTPLYKISSNLGKGQTFASDINQGRVAKKEWLKYPIRKNLEVNKERYGINNEEYN